MTITVHPTLPQAARDIRQQVFVEEQGFQEEFDQIDQRARHLLLYQQGQPVATCRLYADGERNTPRWWAAWPCCRRGGAGRWARRCCGRRRRRRGAWAAGRCFWPPRCRPGAFMKSRATPPGGPN